MRNSRFHINVQNIYRIRRNRTAISFASTWIVGISEQSIERLLEWKECGRAPALYLFEKKYQSERVPQRLQAHSFYRSRIHMGDLNTRMGGMLVNRYPFLRRST